MVLIKSVYSLDGHVCTLCDWPCNAMLAHTALMHLVCIIVQVWE